MDIVNERTTHIVRAAFTDENGDDVTPSTGFYSVFDEKSGTEILEATAFTPSSATHDFEITPEQNRILNSSNRFEERVLTLSFVYNSTREGTGNYKWAIKNMDLFPFNVESS